uniref:Ovule protein n=1 Tax=Schistocephalus solidus TaxID=70667 RepID=A0A183TE22_SCHSO
LNRRSIVPKNLPNMKLICLFGRLKYPFNPTNSLSKWKSIQRSLRRRLRRLLQLKLAFWLDIFPD